VDEAVIGDCDGVGPLKRKKDCSRTDKCYQRKLRPTKLLKDQLFLNLGILFVADVKLTVLFYCSPLSPVVGNRFRLDVFKWPVLFRFLYYSVNGSFFVVTERQMINYGRTELAVGRFDILL